MYNITIYIFHKFIIFIFIKDIYYRYNFIKVCIIVYMYIVYWKLISRASYKYGTIQSIV